MATTPKDQKESRVKILGLNYPDAPDGAHLIQAILELGWAGSSEFGFSPLSWVEIKAYSDATGMINEPWELRCIRDMSVAYATERSQTEALRIAPYDRIEE